MSATPAAEARARLARGEMVSVRVAGGSMEPTLPREAAVLARAGRPRVGDVVLLETHGELVVHRLVARLGPLFVHAGDAPGSAAGLCRARDLLGVVDDVRRVSPSRIARVGHVGRALARALRAKIVA
jgi:hypothetical protein